MSNVPGDLRYTKEHEWVKQSAEKKYRVGITDYAQGALATLSIFSFLKSAMLLLKEKFVAKLNQQKASRKYMHHSREL